jgi:hypothetical protein
VPRFAVLLTVLAALAAAAGCGGGEDAAAIADGRHFGYVRSVDASSDPATIAFDVAEFLTGQEANDAAEADGVIEEGENVPNDYYIRNEDESSEVLDVSPEVRVTHIQCPDSCVEGIAGDFDAFAASFDDAGPPSLTDEYRGAASQYWVTIEDGDVAVIDEQYLP